MYFLQINSALFHKVNFLPIYNFFVQPKMELKRLLVGKKKTQISAFSQPEG